MDEASEPATPALAGPRTAERTPEGHGENERAQAVEIATEYRQRFGFPFIVCAR